MIARQILFDNLEPERAPASSYIRVLELAERLLVSRRVGALLPSASIPAVLIGLHRHSHPPATFTPHHASVISYE